MLMARTPNVTFKKPSNCTLPSASTVTLYFCMDTQRAVKTHLPLQLMKFQLYLLALG